MRELAEDAISRKYAIPAFCAWNAELVDAILRIATDNRAPVILMSGPGEFPLLPPEAQVAVVHGLRKRYAVPSVVHLDHGESLEQVRRCVECGYDSVMIDYSHRPIEENIRMVCQAVQLAHDRNISVESELGAIGRADAATTEGGDRSVFTRPEDAERFVRATKTDLLAPSIGNAHGLYKGKPQLDFQLLGSIREAASVPLVLHGGTGLPKEDIRRAIEGGVVKVNVASELVNTVRESLRSQWGQGKNQWIPMALASAVKQVEAVIDKWIHITDAANRV
jgi:ketose-bisphosphate aldolase